MGTTKFKNCMTLEEHDRSIPKGLLTPDARNELLTRAARKKNFQHAAIMASLFRVIIKFIAISLGEGVTGGLHLSSFG